MILSLLFISGLLGSARVPTGGTHDSSWKTPREMANFQNVNEIRFFMSRSATFFERIECKEVHTHASFIRQTSNPLKSSYRVELLTKRHFHLVCIQPRPIGVFWVFVGVEKLGFVRAKFFQIIHKIVSKLERSRIGLKSSTNLKENFWRHFHLRSRACSAQLSSSRTRHLQSSLSSNP